MHNTTERIMITFLFLLFFSYVPVQNPPLPFSTYASSVCASCFATGGSAYTRLITLVVLLLYSPLGCTYSRGKKKKTQSVSGLYVHYAILALSYIEKDRTQVNWQKSTLYQTGLMRSHGVPWERDDREQSTEQGPNSLFATSEHGLKWSQYQFVFLAG